jgi:zinc transporter
MEDTRACLLCYALDGAGGAAPIELSGVQADDDRMIWIHLNGKHADTRKFLKDQLALDPLYVRSLLAEETRPRLEEQTDNALLILRGIDFNPGPKPEDLVSVRLWISGRQIVSVSRRKARAVSDLDERLRNKHGPRTPGEFIAMLCVCLNDGIEPAIDELEDGITRLEDQSLENPTEELRNDIAATRKQATLFRRNIAPQRDVISRLLHSSLGRLNSDDKWLVQDSFDRITRFLEELDTMRERSQILQDELHSALSSRLNKNLYLLSVITVIFMPLSFLSGLLGMNVAGIPGAQDPWAFAVVCGIAVLIALAQVYLFKLLKWF